MRTLNWRPCHSKVVIQHSDLRLCSVGANVAIVWTDLHLQDVHERRMMIRVEAIGVMHSVLFELQVEEEYCDQRNLLSEPCHPLW